MISYYQTALKFDYCCGAVTDSNLTKNLKVCFPLLFYRGRAQQCQRLFQVNTPVNCMCLHPNQATLIVGDQSGTIHVWDLTTDHNEQLVRVVSRYRVVITSPTTLWHFQIPEPDVAIHSVHIDPDGAYLAAVNSKVHWTSNYSWNTWMPAHYNFIVKSKLHVPMHNLCPQDCYCSSVLKLN